MVMHYLRLEVLDVQFLQGIHHFLCVSVLKVLSEELHGTPLKLLQRHVWRGRGDHIQGLKSVHLIIATL